MNKLYSNEKSSNRDKNALASSRSVMKLNLNNLN